MDDQEKYTRKNRFEKRRKNTKSISILLVIGGFLVLSLIGIWLFGGGSNEVVEEQEEEQVDEEVKADVDEQNLEENTDEKTDENATDGNDDSIEESDNMNENEELDEEVTMEKVEPSDSNVREAYVGDWKPVGTEQEGPHTVNYTNDSRDRIEMREAILAATGLNESDYHEWWIGNGGDQKVIATVSDTAQTEVYRVYLSWIDNEGWQPTKVELLIENDWKKYQ